MARRPDRICARAAAQPTMTTAATATAGVGQAIRDVATLSGGNPPITGTVTFSVYRPLPPNSQLDPCDFTLLADTSTRPVQNGRRVGRLHDARERDLSLDRNVQRRLQQPGCGRSLW